MSPSTIFRKNSRLLLSIGMPLSLHVSSLFAPGKATAGFAAPEVRATLNDVIEMEGQRA